MSIGKKIIQKVKKIMKEMEKNRIKKYGSAPKYEYTSEEKPNCYGYALGLKDNVQPGELSGKKIKNYNKVTEVAKAVEKDVKSMGRSIRKISGPEAIINKNEYRIALRVGTEPYTFEETESGGIVNLYDYHFMVQTSTGRWAEKPGSGTTILHELGETPDTLSWDYIIERGFACDYKEGYYDSKIIYYAISK
jgi:hypothetical protein